MSYRENYALIDWRDLPEEPRASFIRPQRSPYPCPMIICDTMPPVQCMVDGQIYDSKSAMRAIHRDAGVIEIGNDPARLRPRQRLKPDRKAIKTSLEKAEARYNRGERA